MLCCVGCTHSTGPVKNDSNENKLAQNSPREEKKLQKIKIVELPKKQQYFIGEDIDLTGIKLQALYSDGSKTSISLADMTVETVKMFQLGKHAVTLKKGELSASFEIDIAYQENNLPVVYIETNEHVPIASKKSYVIADMKICKDGVVVYKGETRIKGRGNATWYYPKKPYRLKLSKKENLLDMASGKDTAWLLLANYTDKTLLRTQIALKLSEIFEFSWTPKMQFVDLFINGEYLGNYQLSESVKVASNRLNIPKSTGFLIERDQYYTDEPNYFVSAEYQYGYSFKHPDGDKIQPQQRTAILNYINELESALKSSDFKDEHIGYRKYIDVDSFCKWFLFHEALANMDTNPYSYISDLSSDKLKMGPVWDFEWSLGIGWYEGPRPRDVNYWVQKNELYFARLLEDEYFVNELKNIWNNKKAQITSVLIDYINQQAALIKKSRELNFKKWNDLLTNRISVGGIPLGTYDAELACDVEFLKKRIEWLDAEIKKL